MSPEDTREAVRILRANAWDMSNCGRYVACIECGMRHLASGRNRAHRSGCKLMQLVNAYEDLSILT